MVLMTGPRMVELPYLWWKDIGHACWFQLFTKRFPTTLRYSQSISCFLVSYGVIHTYIIGHYNPSVRIIDLVSHTTYAVCVNFIHKWRDLEFKVDSEQQIFWETLHGNFIYSQSFCQKSAERKSPKKYFSYFVLMSGLWLEPWLFV